MSGTIERVEAEQDNEQDPDGPRWRRRSDARPGEIVRAALDVFAEKGFAAARMEEIARRAGVTKGTVYLYFPSKDDLFRAVVHETIVPAVESGERLVAGFEGSAAELIRELVTAWWQRHGGTAQACLGKLVAAEAANFPALARFYMDEVVLRSRALLEGAIRRGIERGEFRPVPVTDAARLAIAPLVHAASYSRSLLQFDTQPMELGAYVELHTEIFLRGIAKGPETDRDA
jgi:AcrR family transcriptional regulator